MIFLSKSKLGTIEAIMLVLTIVVAHSVLSMSTNILSSYKSASILNVIYVSVIAIAITYIIYRLLKNFPNMDIIDISEAVGGKVFKNLVGIVFIIYFILTASLMLRNFCESIQILYFPMTDITFIMTPYINVRKAQPLHYWLLMIIRYIVSMCAAIIYTFRPTLLIRKHIRLFSSERMGTNSVYWFRGFQAATFCW